MQLSQGKFLLLTALALATTALQAQKPGTPDATPAVTSTPVTTTTTGVNGYLPVFTGASTVVNSIVYQTPNGIGIGRTPNAMLDVNGKSIFRGGQVLSRIGDATTSAGAASFGLIMQSSVYNSSKAQTLLPYFQLQTEPTGNNTANTNATFNFLYYSGIGANPVETGLYFNPNGTIHFAPAQTFPGGPGSGTISGVTAGTGLTGGGTTGVVTLKVAAPLSLSAAATGVIMGTDTGENGEGVGVYGTSGNNIGVMGTGPYAGVVGNSSVGNGVEGDGPVGVAGIGSKVGVIASGGPIGLQATAQGTDSETTFGVDARGPTAINAYSTVAGGTGVYAVAENGSAVDYAIWGVSNSGYAGVFSGNVSVGGTLTKSAGTFKIDDPLDPENKYLSHSFVESPDMMNIYNGIAALDGNGEATVQMPDYFVALNKDYRYQLTAMGAPGPNLFIAEEIANNQFRIAGGRAGMKVSWQVTGIRQDAYANAHRTPIQEDKPGKEKGTYLHPELFGQPEEKGLEWAIHPEMMQRVKQARKQ